MGQNKKVKFHYVELKKFNKLSHKLPENVMAVFAHNKKWFPILPEFFDIKSEIIKMVTEYENPEFIEGYNSLTIEWRYCAEDMLIGTTNSEIYLFFDEVFTWKQTMWTVYSIRNRVNYYVWYKNNKDWINQKNNIYTYFMRLLFTH
jgi:hypothetical protein